MEAKLYQAEFLERAKRHRQEFKGEPLLAVAPPGAGKSYLMERLAIDEIAANGRVVLLAHRNMLIDQLVEDFNRANLPYSVLAGGYDYDLRQPIIIASLPMLYSRCIRTGNEFLPDATLVLVDEGHLHVGATFRSVIYGAVKDSLVTQGFAARGADVIGFTATPIMSRNGIYAHMDQIVNYSQLRKERMHQMLQTFSPDEIDVAQLKTNASGDFSEKELSQRAMAIYASAIDESYKLNPEMKPMLLYAPSVPTSRWFCEQFNKAGIKSAHIDGLHCMIPQEDGSIKQTASSREAKADIIERHKNGDIKLICNRFVLREGINLP